MLFYDNLFALGIIGWVLTIGATIAGIRHKGRKKWLFFIPLNLTIFGALAAEFLLKSSFEYIFFAGLPIAALVFMTVQATAIISPSYAVLLPVLCTVIVTFGIVRFLPRLGYVASFVGLAAGLLAYVVMAEQLSQIMMREDARTFGVTEFHRIPIWQSLALREKSHWIGNEHARFTIDDQVYIWSYHDKEFVPRRE